MAQKCKAKKVNGENCDAYALASGEYCFTHDPARVKDRAAARKQGGYNRRAGHSGDYSGPHQVRSLAMVLEVLDYVLAESLKLENSIARGRLLVALASEYTNAIRSGDQEERLKRLEDLAGLMAGEDIE